MIPTCQGRLRLQVMLVAATLLLPTLSAASDAAKVRVIGKDLSGEHISEVGKALENAGLMVAPPLTREGAKLIAAEDLIGEGAPGLKHSAGADYMMFVAAVDQNNTDLMRGTWIDARTGEVLAVQAMDIDELDDNVRAMLDAVRSTQEFEAKRIATGDKVEVEVRVRGYAKAGMPASAADKVSLMTAKRAAVEKAYGAVVDVNVLGGVKKVTAKAAGTLSYKIVERGQDDTGAYTDIVASVDVPKSLVDQAPATEQYPTETGEQPYVNDSGRGKIDWQAGTITAKGKAKGTDLKARRAALVDAYGAALQLVKGIAVNSEQRVGESMARDSDKAVEVEGLVRQADITKSQINGAMTEVEIQLPVYGVQGIQSAFHRPKKATATDTQVAEDDGPTGIIIDASGTDMRPTLQPKFYDVDGDLLFDAAKDGDPEAMEAYGAAAYVAKPQQDSHYFDADWPRIAAKMTPEGDIVLATTGRALLPLLFDQDLMLADKKKKKRKKRRRRRQGAQPATIKGGSTKGRMPSNLVVSVKQKDKAKLRDRLKGLFAKGKVVIYMQSAIGGVEGAIDGTEQASINTPGIR